MQQPELGKLLTALRKEKNLTQEELVEKSHVSVRTIQRIEAGEVLPRVSTIKILLSALGENYDSILNQQPQVMKTQMNTFPTSTRTTLLIAVIAGTIYLITEIILGTLDISWINEKREWGMRMNIIYVTLTVLMVVAFVLFARGFITLSILFENTLLKLAAYLLTLATIGKGITDIIFLSETNIDHVWIPYAGIAVIMGAVGIIFGVSLIRLQDSMGELSRVAGILEIVMGSLLITVILFFISYVILIPTVIIEILVLYRGYEYVSKSTPPVSS